MGRMPLEQVIDMIYTADVFMHRWDLARATGQDESLDPEKCAVMLEGMLPMDEVMRQSGQYGPRGRGPGRRRRPDPAAGVHRSHAVGGRLPAAEELTGRGQRPGITSGTSRPYSRLQLSCSIFLTSAFGRPRKLRSMVMRLFGQSVPVCG